MAGKRSVASASLSSNYRSASAKFSSTSKSSKISSNKTSGSGKLNSGSNKSSSVSRASTARADLTAPIESKHRSPVNWNQISSATTSASVSSSTASTGTVSSSVSNTNSGSATSVAATVSISGGMTVVNNESGSVVKKAAAVSENTVSVPRGEVHVSTAVKDIAPVSKTIQSEVHKGVGQLKDVQTLNKNQWLDTGTKNEAVTSDAERAAQVSDRLEKQSESRRYHPVFTGESSNSIASNKRIKIQVKPSLLVKIEYADQFIPKYVKNGTVLAFLDKMSNVFKISKSTRTAHNKYNKEEIKKMEDTGNYTEGEVINNQKKWGNVKFGTAPKSNMKYSGCEIIAVYNALVMMGEKVSGKDLANMITVFEKNGAVLNGAWGTSPQAMYEYMDKKYKKDPNINVEMYVPKNKKDDGYNLDNIGENNEVFIATVYNDKNKISKQIHTVCISKEENGTYTVYNAGEEKAGQFFSKPGYQTLSDAIAGISNSGESQLISLISIGNNNLGDYPNTGRYDTCV